MIRKSKNFRSAVKKADRYFSLYTRLTHANVNGWCACVTCGKTFHYKEGDAGHFIGRNHMSTRYSLDNVFPQCLRCNRFCDERAEFSLFLLKRLGRKKFEKLIKNGADIRKFTVTELDGLSDKYNNLVKKIQKEKYTGEIIDGV